MREQNVAEIMYLMIGVIQEEGVEKETAVNESRKGAGIWLSWKSAWPILSALQRCLTCWNRSCNLALGREGQEDWKLRVNLT